MKRVDHWPLAVLIVAAGAFTFAVLWRRSLDGLGQPSLDTYGFFYPNQVYAWRSVREGAGLLWNRYQDCGQPFFAMSQVGLLYPVNIVFALFDREPALLASALINLSIAGAGTFLLARALGLSRVPALCAALAFQLGWVATWLASWSPIHIAALAWMPVALWRTERLIAAPDVKRTILLGVVLTVALLPGFYQIGFYIYQLIALRVLWACVVGRAARPARLTGLVALALIVPLLLGAVQLLPSIEVARHSLRGLQVSARDIGGGFSWANLTASLTSQVVSAGSAVVVLLAVLALVPVGERAQWDSVGFYWPVAALYFVLSLGPGSGLYELYARLPFGGAFRGAWRLVWVTNLAIAILAGWGAELVVRRAGRAAAPLRLGVMVLLPLAIALSGIFLARYPVPLFGLRQGDVYGPHAAAFAAVRERLTPQDRVLIAGGFPDFSLMPKSASLFALPSIFDYETQAPRRYVDYFTYMRTGHRLQHLDEWYWMFDKLLLPTLRRPLFDLVGTRYVITDRPAERVAQALPGGVRMLEDRAGVRIYENEQVLPRARFVPQLVVAGEDETLAELASGARDAGAVAWVSDAPRSGFMGAPGDAAGSAVIERDDGEVVAVRVRAPQRGFLFLADQHFPGWTVQVNGADADVLRANLAFRLVEVPAGESEVVFTYRPLSVRLGALLSIATAVVLTLLWRRAGRSRRATALPG
jgi:hypothetical protein